MSNENASTTSTTPSTSTETQTPEAAQTNEQATTPEPEAPPPSASVLDDDNQTPADQPAEAAAEAPKFDLTDVALDDLKGAMPEGFEISDEQASKFTEILNGSASKKELAEKLVAFQADLVRADIDSTVNEFNTRTEEWRTAIKAEHGAQYEERRGAVKEMIQTYAEKPDEIFEILRVSGLGSHPGLFNLFNKLSTTLSAEATPVNGSVAQGRPSRAERLFPEAPQ